MTSRLLTPWVTRPVRGGVADPPGGTEPTPILDWRSPAVQGLMTEVRTRAGSRDARAALVAGHALIASCVRPVYAVQDLQPPSRTIARGRGSCSQRFAVLEAVARGIGVPTRAHGLLVDGRFWYPRFGRLRWLVPDTVVPAWPEFQLDGAWLSAAELFETPEACGVPFTNSGTETLFDAVARTRVHWVGAPGGGDCDLSAVVRQDLGRFDSRDELFSQQGQTLCATARLVSDPVLGRWSAGAA